MKLSWCICGAICSALVLAGPAAAKSTVLQIVDLTELAMSTEGGEATLYRVNKVKHAVCRIEAIHLGETGKMIQVFDFGSKLYAAEQREYRYKAPLSIDPKAEPILAKTLTLTSEEGQKTLPKDFETFKALFDPTQLAKCVER